MLPWMRFSVRTKLVGMVAICTVPAILAAVYRQMEARSDLYQEVEDLIRHADDRFVAELQEDQSAARMAARLAAADRRLAKGLADGDLREAEEVLKAIEGVDGEAIVAVVDARGTFVASSEPKRLPPSLDPAALEALKRGEEVAGLFHLGDSLPAFVIAEPVRRESGGERLGALAMIMPLDAGYLEHLESKLSTDLSVRVNGRVVASCPDHPAPDLEVQGEKVVQRRERGHLFTLTSFRPALLQRPGEVVEITASQDVTALRDESTKDLVHLLATLGVIVAVAVGVALLIARGMGRAIGRLSQAAGEVAKGGRPRVEGVHTGDELESLATAFNGMVESLEALEKLKARYGKYMSRQVMERLSRDNPELGRGETIPVTVLFSDIRGFTSISERMRPRDLLDFLNVYFTAMVESVLKHHGAVDKFIGDAIMAVFGAPEPHPDDAIRAVRAAMEMRAKLQGLNDGFRSRGQPEINFGIGIHSGEVVAGDMGHQDRMEYAVIGDAVNLASRLESLTKEMGVSVLLSEDTYRQVKDQVQAEPLRRVKVKGREQEVMVYRLVGVTGTFQQKAGSA